MMFKTGKNNRRTVSVEPLSWSKTQDADIVWQNSPDDDLIDPMLFGNIYILWD
jgi:hypothetical protein